MGLGSSLLLTRLATRRAKPDGAFHLEDSEAREFMRSVPAADLPGVGRVTARRLREEMSVETCEQLQEVPLSRLQAAFGTKIGRGLHEHCRGVDGRSLSLEQERKSVSAEVNYGIRFKKEEDFGEFLDRLSREVASRLERAGFPAGGRCVTLKLMVRAEGASEQTSKFMGHGVCDSLSRSSTLSSATGDAEAIAREARLLARQLGARCEDLRGIGIQMSKLEGGGSRGGSSRLSSGGGTKSILSFVRKKSEPNTEENEEEQRGEKEKPKKSAKTEDPPPPPRFEDISFSQIDPEVMEALPAEIRQEVVASYSNRRAELPAASGTQGNFGDPTPGTSLGAREGRKAAAAKDLLNATISQLDPEYLSELPPEIAEEVRRDLINAKRGGEGAQRPPPPPPPDAFSALMMSSKSPPKKAATPTGRKKRGRPAKNSPRFIKSSAKTQAAKASKGLFKEESPVKGLKTASLARQEEAHVEEGETKDVVVAHKQEEEEEANLEGETELEGVRSLLKQWLLAFPNGPTSDDLSTVSKYFRQLVKQKLRIDLAPPLLRMLERLTGKPTMSDSWAEAYRAVVDAVQDEMALVFGYKLCY